MNYQIQNRKNLRDTTNAITRRMWQAPEGLYNQNNKMFPTPGAYEIIWSFSHNKVAN